MRFTVIYPHDFSAQKGISHAEKFSKGANDDLFLQKLRNTLPQQLDQFQPVLFNVFVFYNFFRCLFFFGNVCVKLLCVFLCVFVCFCIFCKELIIYNAGTDILEGDPLGCMNITPNAIIERDDIVFNEALQRHIPIVMLLSGFLSLRFFLRRCMGFVCARCVLCVCINILFFFIVSCGNESIKQNTKKNIGGYQKSNAKIITDSIVNLNTKYELFANPNKIESSNNNNDNNKTNVQTEIAPEKYNNDEQKEPET